MELASNTQMFLSSVPASLRDRRLALAVVLLSVLVFAALLPFAKTQLAQVWAFIPCYESMLVTSDLVTVVLLLGQATASRSRAMVVLACGYLYTAVMTVIHLLTYPGVFAADGLLGAGTQSTAWLYNFWHGGFPLFAIAFVWLRQTEFSAAASSRSLIRGFLALAAGILALAGALAALAIWGDGLLPAIIRNGRYTPAMQYVVAATWSLSLCALAVLWSVHRRTVLDLWLTVVMIAWLIDIALSALLNGARFDLGFYAGRIYGLMAANFVLMVLLVENGALYFNLIQMANELRCLSGLDALTGIANRRTFDARLEAEWRRALRNRSPLSLLMVDIDYFKAYNDAYGHVQGDVCLRAVAEVLARFARRAGELSARYGGEEFALLLPLLDVDEASGIGAEIRAALEQAALPHGKSAVAGHVTVSIGVAGVQAMRDGAQTAAARPQFAVVAHGPPGQLVELADRALYQTKTAGRNGVSVGGVLWVEEACVSSAVAA